MKMDDHTADYTRVSFARVCVEMNVLEPPIKQVWVGWGDHTQEIVVVYEKIHGYCMDYKMLGQALLCLVPPLIKCPRRVLFLS